MEDSKLGLRVWAVAIYLLTTGIKGVSSMKLHRDLGVTQKTAWHLAHRIRKTWENNVTDWFTGPVEVDETYIGGKEKNKHWDKRLRAGRGAVGKTPVVGIKDRDTNRVVANVVDRTDRETLQGFVVDYVEDDYPVYTDDHRSYRGLDYWFFHKTVRHSIREYVKSQAHINGIESFWALLKRGYHGTYHHMSPKHLQRYVTEFAGRHNQRSADTVDQMKSVVRGMIGKRLRYKELIGKP